MSWIRIDDQMADHPKVLGMGDLAPLALALQVRALCYAARYLTDGRLPAGAIPGLLEGFAAWGIEMGGVPGMFSHGVTAEELDWPGIMVTAGLWDPIDDGFAIHDYLEYNPARSVVLKERKANAKRQQRLRERHRTVESNGATSPEVQTAPTPTPSPTPKELRSSARAAWSEILRQVPEAYRDGIDGFVRAAQDPEAVILTLRAAGPGGANQCASSWELVGRAALELRAAGGGFSPLRLAAFCRKLAEAPRGAPGENDADRMARARLQLERGEA